MSEEKEVEEEEKQEEAKEQETTEQLPVEELIKKIQELEEQLKEVKKDYEGLHSMYEEVIENMKEEKPEGEEVKFPTFEEWLKDLYEKMKKEAEEEPKYPYYPYYPYPKYPKYPGMTIIKLAKEEEKSQEEEAKGEGAVEMTEEAKLREKAEKIAERLRGNKKIKEQWTTPVFKSDHEIVGHARQFCRIDRLLEGKPGDTVHIATVRDFDFGPWGDYGAATLADETGTDVIAFDSATVKESGVQFYLKKHLVEKADANVVEMVNEVVRRAAARAEDALILNTIYNTSDILALDKSAAGVDFDADWIPEIVSTFQENGVDVQPGDIVLFICPEMYEALLKDIAGAMGLVFARPDVVQKGRITEFMGVPIRVVSKSILPNDGTNYYAIAWKKNAVTLAPKRDVEIETEPDVANRRTLVVATHAAACVLANPKYGMKIKTQVT